MEKTFAYYRHFESNAEQGESRMVFIKFSQDFKTENEALKYLKNSEDPGGHYMILPSYYKHEPEK